MADGIQPISQDVKSKEEIIDVIFDGKTEREKFMKELQSEQRKYTIAHEPFSYRAAKDSFVAEQKKEFSKHGKRIADREENVKIAKFDFKKFADKSRFNLLRKTPINEQKLMDGMRMSIETGMWYDYQDKNNGHRISVEVPHEKPANKQ